MIQAPQSQYVPQHIVQPGYQQQQGAYTPVQPQNTQVPGTIYNYPVANSYSSIPPRSQAQYNGVNIEILNPQGQGGYGVPQQGNFATQQGNGQFNGVNLEIKNPQGQGPSPYPYMMPAQFYPVQQPQITLPPVSEYPAVPPANVLPAIPPSPAPEQQINNQIEKLPQQPNENAPLIDEPTTQNPNAALESFTGRLNTDNLDEQRAAIEEIAQKVRNQDADGTFLIDSQIFDALSDIVNKDTSTLDGPTPEMLEIREKDPATLTDEEKLSLNPTPLENAEINKKFALFTLSFMYERLNNELNKAGRDVVVFKELPRIETLTNELEQNENPELRFSAIVALSHIQRPEYKDDLNALFTQVVQSDNDENVKETAMQAIRNLENLDVSGDNKVESEYNTAA